MPNISLACATSSKGQLRPRRPTARPAFAGAPRLWGAPKARGWWVCALMDGQRAGGSFLQTSSLLGAWRTEHQWRPAAHAHTPGHRLDCLSELRATATTSSSTMQRQLDAKVPFHTHQQACSADHGAAGKGPAADCWAPDADLAWSLCPCVGRQELHPLRVAATASFREHRSTAAARDALGCQPANTAMLQKERKPHGTPACTETKQSVHDCTPAHSIQH